jgi:hypothetical protein
VSDGPIPKNWREALPFLVWGVLIFACGFEGIASLLHGEWLQAALGLGGMFGLTAMLIHWTRIRDNFADVRWLMAAIMVALVVSALSPYVEQHRWPFSTVFHDAPPADAVAKAVEEQTQSIRFQLNGAIQIQGQLKDENDHLRQKLIEIQGQLDAAQKQIAELRKQRPAPPPPPSGGPITWNSRLILGMGSPSGVKYLILGGSIVGPAVVQLKDAHIVSDLTGETRNFLISTRAHNLDAERLPLDEINPLPPGMEIWLVVEWPTSLSVQEFLNQWGKFNLTVHYGDSTYSRYVDEDEIKSDLLSDIGGADLVLGIPRVTKKSPQ